MTLAKVINLDPEAPLYKIRERIRTGHRELKKAGYLSKAMINKNDVARIWKKTG